MDREGEYLSPQAKTDASLRTLLTNHEVPDSTLHIIENRFVRLQRQATERGQLINSRCRQVHELKIQIQKQEQLLEENSRTILQLKADREQQYSHVRKQYAELEVTLELQRHLLDFGAGAMKDQRHKVERLEAEKMELLQKVRNQGMQIETLNKNVAQNEPATEDEIVQLALEAQAQRTLTVIRGLNNDLTKKESIIRNQQRVLAERDATISALEIQRREAVEVTATAERAIRAARNRASEALRISEQQQSLIERLMHSNTQLAVADCCTKKDDFVDRSAGCALPKS